MFATHTLSRRLLYTMFPWYLLIALSMTAAQLAIQYLSVSSAINNDLASLGRTVEPSVTNSVWELDSPQLDSIVRGVRQNVIVTGVLVESSSGEVLVTNGDLPASSSKAGGFFQGQFKQTVVPLIYQSPRGERRLIGRLKMYSNLDVLWDRTKYSFLLVLLNSIVVTVGLWLIFLWTINFHLSDTLTQVANAVKNWRFQPSDAPVEKIEYPYRDELGELVNAFNESRIRLFNSLKELSKLNRNLDEHSRELEQTNRELGRSNKELEQFAFAASHDLQTPIRAVASFAQLLEQQFSGKLGSEGDSYIRQIVTNSHRMQRLVSSLLEYSMISAKPDRHWVNFDILIEKLQEDLRPLIQERSAIFDCASLPTLHVDARQLHQLLRNLISNAIKFQPGDKPVVRIAARQEAGGWIISVSDKGIGIEPRHQQRIFQMFQRLHTFDQYEGDGIGLSMAEKIVHIHGGKLWVESALGKGSTFSFSIPDSGDHH